MITKSDNPRRALGKGLNSLLPARGPKNETAEIDDKSPVWRAAVTELAIDQIRPNPNQPRRQFQDDKLEELARSIKLDGIIQPLVVRRVGSDYQLVAGERRWRAARLAGLARVPVVVREIADEKLLEIALIENIQREDLNPLELAEAFQRMSQDLGLNHEEIGERTGKDRVTITNYIRLLQLPADLLELVAERKLSPGHARAILRLPDELQRQTAKRAIQEGWSVRQLEKATSPEGARSRRKTGASESALDPNVKAAVGEMERVLGTRVTVIEKRAGKGHLEIEYYSNEDLDRIYELIVKT
ncbi:MAG: ParB/RepB/Spo0J family partition protein [Acidobacteriota bacterium]|nr:ParB/RepB/Spo0J family partition protein [Acidobacteriota bacterium]